MLDFIAKPFGILMMWLYQLTHNYMLAVILFSLIVKLILLPFQMKSKKGMMRQQLLIPQQQELAKKYGSNKQKYQEELMKLYQEEGVSPMSGCLWALLPFPILIALYSAIRKPLSTMMGVAAKELQSGGAVYDALKGLGHTLTSDGYGEIHAVKVIHQHWSDVFEGLNVTKLQDMDYMSFGLDLGAQPSFKFWTWDWSSVSVWLPTLGLFLIPIVAALLTLLPTKLSKKLNAETMKAAGLDPPQEQQGQGFLTVFMPLSTLIFCFWMPAALGVYWIANSVFTVLQDIILTKHYNKTVAAESADRIAARRAREAELERKRQESERRRAVEGSVENASTSRKKQQNKKKKEQSDKTLEWQRAHNPEEPVYEPSRVGTRRYARGRAYDPDRFSRNGVEGATESTSELDEAITEEQEEKLQRAALPTSGVADVSGAADVSDENEPIDEAVDSDSGEVTDDSETDDSIIE